MLVEQLMTRPVYQCRPEDTLAQAARLMWEHDCGSLPVVGTDGATGIAGMITDRDICMCALFRGRSPNDLQVSDAIANKEVQTCRADDTLAKAEQVMRQAQIRRLPVTDEDGTLVGMITLADLAREAARETTGARHEITEAEIGDTLAAICASSSRQLAA